MLIILLTTLTACSKYDKPIVGKNHNNGYHCRQIVRQLHTQRHTLQHTAITSAKLMKEYRRYDCRHHHTTISNK